VSFEQPVGELGMRIDSATDDGDHHGRRTEMNVPPVQGVNVRSDYPSLVVNFLSGVAQAPLTIEVQIVGQSAGSSSQRQSQY
jgi:hypothetical protein